MKKILKTILQNRLVDVYKRQILQSPTKAKGQVKLIMKKAKNKGVLSSDYKDILKSLEEE